LPEGREAHEGFGEGDRAVEGGGYGVVDVGVVGLLNWVGGSGGLGLGLGWGGMGGAVVVKDGVVACKTDNYHSGVEGEFASAERGLGCRGGSGVGGRW